jgi:hypothetical protein
VKKRWYPKIHTRYDDDKGEQVSMCTTTATTKLTTTTTTTTTTDELYKTTCPM